ncbi:DUF2634 domain-containing protein [Cohnella pontilimi]|uniref:DUF2634 domain-containing protein n=1 Tax=Cohnella pontilimi TaxID=2564100 RepID=A0A4U0FCL7_9BACL|nr:GPW/gp25 family protein [Cohnella pontilimi]TJY42626.1 DUF2634 domain-containing protein [Cohnella pontilimi]
MDRTGFGTDIQLSHRLTLGSALYVQPHGGDFGTVAELDNLEQALWMRLGVPMGDLTHLGHPDYGSRLHLLIGRLATPETIALARAYIREALRREPRVAEVSRLEIEADPTAPGTLMIAISVRPAGQNDPIAMSANFALDPGQTEAIPDAAAFR